ncbi:uncharacterized protein LOC110452373 [Mizuhopecten yessoensis]|uniref:uncharacterized protein LOC110452373 n=1 Tax=Mizuhopecten yessoensis TaxID=6573 RepID=UPI000B459CDA|nr:uncharacterized protein LOC110452373 [Mizuhopecten yessoensis]
MELSKQLSADDLGMTLDPDIDDLRGQQESEASWQRRRRFLLVHQGRFPIGRLNQLSYCFTNILMYACEYSDSLMKELSALAVDVAIANSLKRGDASVKVSKNYLKDKMSNKKNALSAEMHYMKKLNDLRKKQINCPSEELNELKVGGECNYFEDVLADRQSRLQSWEQTTVAVKEEQKLRRSSKSSPLRQKSFSSRLIQSSKLTPLGKSSELSSLRQNSELSPLRQSSELPPFRHSAECSPFGQSSELSLFGRLKMTTNKDDNCKKFEESTALQYEKETNKTLLMGISRLLCSDARRQAEEAKALRTLKKDNHESAPNPGKNVSLLSRPESVYGHELQSVNFEPRTSCLNRESRVHRSSSVGLSLDGSKTACIESCKDVHSLAEPTGSVLSEAPDDGSRVKEAYLSKSRDQFGGGRVNHSHRKGTSHLWQSSEQDTRGEINHDLSREGAYSKRSLELTNQGDITPLSVSLLSGTLQKGKGNVSRKDGAHDLSTESKVSDRRETTQMTLSDTETIDWRFRPREMESMTDQPDQNSNDPSNSTEMLTKSEIDKILQSFVPNSRKTRKERAPEIGTIIKQLELLKISVTDETETLANQQLVTSESASREKSQREKTRVYVSSKRRGEITPMTAKANQQGRVGISPVQKKKKSKFPVFEFRKKLKGPQNSSLKSFMNAHRKGQQVRQFKSEKLEYTEEPKQNDGEGSRSQNEHVVASQLCDGLRTDDCQPRTDDTCVEKDVLPDDKYWHQLSDEPPSKTRCKKERSVLKESNSHRASGHYPYSKTLRNTGLTTEMPLNNTQNDARSRTPIETLNESSRNMCVPPQGKSEKTIDCSVKSSPTTRSLYKAQQTYRRLQRIKSQDTVNFRTEVDSGQMQNVQIGLSQKLVKSDHQQRVSDFMINTPGKQFVTSAVEHKASKQEPEKVCASSVADIKEPLPSYFKSQRKDISLYTEKLVRKFSSKSLTEMAGRDSKNVTDISKKGSTKVGKEDSCAGTKTQRQQVMEPSPKSSKMAEFLDKFYCSSFEGGGSFLVPNMQSQVQGQKRQHQIAPDSLKVKSNQGHLEVKVSGSAASVVRGSALDSDVSKLA